MTNTTMPPPMLRDGSTTAASSAYPSYSTEADFVFGCLYLVCILFGVPGNILALRYFSSKRKDLATYLYMLISTNDILICAFVVMQVPVMFNDRSSSLYSGTYACVIWMNLYQLFTRMSIALTATLSVSRTRCLIWPLKTVHKKPIFIGLGCYAAFIVLMTVIPCSLGVQYGTYDSSGAMCWLLPTDSDIGDIWDYVDNIVDCCALAVPIIPITISCLISSYKMSFDSGEPVGDQGRGADIKRRATVTIIIFTAVYFFFNLPLFIAYIFWFITAAKYSYPGPYFSSAVMYNYAWNYTEVLAVCLNSVCNPIIFFIRIKKFRDFVLKKQEELSSRVSVISVHARTMLGKEKSSDASTVLSADPTHDTDCFEMISPDKDDPGGIVSLTEHDSVRDDPEPLKLESHNRTKSLKKKLTVYFADDQEGRKITKAGGCAELASDTKQEGDAEEPEEEQTRQSLDADHDLSSCNVDTEELERWHIV